MPYDLNANDELEYVHLTYSGTVDFAERKKAKDAVFALIFEKNFYRTLVDLRVSDIQISESDLIKFASSFKNTKIPNNYRLACVVNPDNHTDNLVETIIALDGINVKNFCNFQEAENWLTAI